MRMSYFNVIQTQEVIFPVIPVGIALIDAICRAVSSNSNINTDDHIRQMERRLLNHKIFI